MKHEKFVPYENVSISDVISALNMLVGEFNKTMKIIDKLSLKNWNSQTECSQSEFVAAVQLMIIKINDALQAILQEFLPKGECDLENFFNQRILKTISSILRSELPSTETLEIELPKININLTFTDHPNQKLQEKLREEVFRTVYRILKDHGERHE